jgi:hypothetical protein
MQCKKPGLSLPLHCTLSRKLLIAALTLAHTCYKHSFFAAAAAAAAAAVLAKKPEYAAVLERMCEPERLIVFR